MATTHLASWGAPGPQVFKTGATHTATLIGKTQLRVTGAPGPRNVITDHTASILVPIVTTDSLSVQWLEDPVDTNSILSQEAIRFSVAELSQLYNQIISGDTASITLSETVALLQQGVVLFTSSDTVSVTLSEASALKVAIDTSDIVSISFADVSTLTTPTLIVPSTDTVSVTLTETSVLGIFTGILQFNSGDNLAVAFDETSELTMITPARPALIRIQPLTARIQIVPL